MFNNQRYGDLDQFFRNNGKNINYVKKLQPYKKIIEQTLTDVGLFTINQLYNSGDSETSFTPYLGITEYNYHHNGTLNNSYIRLKEYRLSDN